MSLAKKVVEGIYTMETIENAMNWILYSFKNGVQNINKKELDINLKNLDNIDTVISII